MEKTDFIIITALIYVEYINNTSKRLSSLEKQDF